MDHRRVLADSSVIIEYIRKKRKERTALIYLQKNGVEVCISSVAVFEVISGINPQNKEIIRQLFNKFEVLPFDTQGARAAAAIYKQLKAQNKLIEFRDIFIAAIAIANDLPLATLNTRHFERIENLQLASWSKDLTGFGNL